jgi:hypothetical protein
MTLEVAIAPTRLVAMCLGPESGGAFDIGEVRRRSPGPDENPHCGRSRFGQPDRRSSRRRIWPNAAVSHGRVTVSDDARQ